MIFYNGATGSLGQYFAGSLAASGRPGHALRARLEDREGLARELVSQAAPGTEVWLVQMAAKVSVPECERDPAAAERTNVTDTAATVLDFVRWARSQRARPRVLLVSSGHVYAAQPTGSRVRESDPVQPRSQYARTKLEAERVLSVQASEHAYPLTIARVFGLIAPRQPANYMLQGMLRRARLRELQGVPGLGYHRDLLDSRDVCRHLLSLCADDVAADSVRVLNVCSGVPVQLRDILAQLLELLHPGEAQQLLESTVEAPGRVDDAPWIVGDPSALENAIGAPLQRISLEATLRDAVAAS